MTKTIAASPAKAKGKAKMLDIPVLEKTSLPCPTQKGLLSESLFLHPHFSSLEEDYPNDTNHQGGVREALLEQTFKDFVETLIT